ncbi:MAG: zinc ribbon domain-containing protein [Lachnospiraceae bacterium]|nr:zinc ribbon domain-containing protein [Lachnospiraceae bacterium]
MAFFDSMKETLTTAGRDVSQKAKEVSGVAKLKLDIKSKEDAINKEYIELGKQYFENNHDSDEAGIVNIRNLQEEIANLRDQILSLQGVCVCPQCKKTHPIGTAFCSQCGTKIDDAGEN